MNENTTYTTAYTARRKPTNIRLANILRDMVVGETFVTSDINAGRLANSLSRATKRHFETKLSVQRIEDNMTLINCIRA